LVPESWDGVRAGSDLQRKDVHPLEEAQGFRALLDLDEPKYSIEQIAAKVGKSAVFVAILRSGIS
jgi:ParB-like chromosome segregation protein Spo0J